MKARKSGFIKATYDVRKVGLREENLIQSLSTRYVPFQPPAQRAESTGELLRLPGDVGCDLTFCQPELLIDEEGGTVWMWQLQW